MAYWTEDQDALLKTLVRQGRSARQIGEAMEVSRNAIIGRCHRLKLKLKGGDVVPRPWTAEDDKRFAILRKLGLSFASIAREMRCGISTIRYRAERMRRAKAPVASAPVAPPPRPIKADPTSVQAIRAAVNREAKREATPFVLPRKRAPLVAEPIPAPEAAPMGFLEAVEANRCLYFSGDWKSPAGPDMPVCGAERDGGTRYCAHHRQRSSQVQPFAEAAE